MTIFKVDGKLRACFTAKELSMLIVSKFFSSLLSKISNKPYNETEVATYIKKLADNSVDSIDYEFFISIFDLYKQFNKECDFCFNLNSKFNFKKDTIKTLNELSHFREDPPDVIVKYRDKFFEFELKRYRRILAVDSLFSFIRDKIIMHYSGYSNFLIILQPKPKAELPLDMFKDIHTRIKKLNRHNGIIGFSLNNNNKELILARVSPKLEIYKFPFENETSLLSEIINSD
jgi:hypothetical protein